jgi:alkyl sulfatase BDS1-like metallo-beta-lactamase superfamily hydrolase
VLTVYQRYLEFYDCNPASMNTLPAVEAARKTIAWMGRVGAVLAKARES